MSGIWPVGAPCVADQQVAAVAALDPVVALVALQLVVVLAAEDDVVAETAQHLVDALAAVDEVVAVAAEHDVVADAGVDGVVAAVAMDDVVAGRVGDDVVAGAAEQLVVAVAAVDVVVAAVAPDRVVVGLAREQPVVALGAAQHDGVAEEVVVADEVHGAVGEHLDQLRPGHRIVQPGRGIGGDAMAVGVEQEVAVGVLQEVVRGLDRVFRRQEDARRQMLGAGVLHDHRGEGVGLDLAAEVRAFDARQVVEAVAVLQALELRLEDEVEGRAQQAAEQILLLGQAADPQIDIVEAGDRAGAPLGMHRERIVQIVGIHAQAVHEVDRRPGEAGVALVWLGRIELLPISTRSSAAARFSSSVVAPMIEACVP